MTNIQELYESKYGRRLSMTLRSLGGNPGQIYADWQNRLDNPSENDLLCQQVFHWPALDAEGAAEGAHNQIIREIERLYFSGTPRDMAVALSNMLLRADLGQFCIVSGEDDLTYNANTFHRTWNNHNPESSPIVLTGEDWI